MRLIFITFLDGVKTFGVTSLNEKTALAGGFFEGP
jgi:hypothetical protein